jgi:formylglycine-generating enzyme required for sulfatase activity
MKCFFWILAVCAVLAGGAAEAGEIVALCIGNNAYSREEDVLDTPVNDARLMHRTLSAVPGVEAGDVVLLEDARRNQITLALRQFKARARKAKLALVFYSGHGVEDRPEGYDRGETFLLPVDAPIDSVDELPDKAVPLKTVLEAMEGNRGMAHVVILDCCRTGAPSAKRLLGRAGKDQENLDERVKKALGSAVVPEGTLIAFATSPGRKAAAFLKESDSNSPFTRFVCEQMGSRGGNLLSIVTEATKVTKERTAMRQVPHVELRGDASLIMDYEIPKRLGNGKEGGTGTEAALAAERQRLETERRALEEEKKRLEMAKLMPPKTAVPAPVPGVDAEPSRAAEGAVGKTLDVSLPGGKGMRFCYCPPGNFRMGSPLNEHGRSDDENQVSVTISQGFWMAETEVTQEQWLAVMGTNPSSFKGSSRPVANVSWDDAQKMVGKLNREVRPPNGLKFALPSEAQWEYACRAGTQTAYAFGSKLTKQDANYESKQTVPVKSYRPNRWGLYDMHGNVWEWCLDWYGNRLQGGVDPEGASSGVVRVIRGGCSGNVADFCRAAFHFWNEPGVRDDGLGFRPVLVPSK